MLRCVWILTAVLFAACSRELSESGTVGGPAATSGGLAKCPGRYVNAPYGYSLEVPCGWLWQVTNENPAAPERVIRQSVVFRGPEGGLIDVSLWDNPSRLSLDAWIERHRDVALYTGMVSERREKAGIRGYDAVAGSVRSGYAPPFDLVLIDTGPHVVRIQYENSDRSRSAAVFRRMVETFEN